MKIKPEKIVKIHYRFTKKNKEKNQMANTKRKENASSSKEGQNHNYNAPYLCCNCR